jgi:hypothetical protein
LNPVASKKAKSPGCLHPGPIAKNIFAMSVMLRFSSQIVEESTFARVHGHEHVLLK